LLAGGFSFHALISSTDVLDAIRLIASFPPTSCPCVSCIDSRLFEIRMVSHSGKIYNGAFEIPAAYRDEARLASN